MKVPDSDLWHPNFNGIKWGGGEIREQYSEEPAIINGYVTVCDWKFTSVM